MRTLPLLAFLILATTAAQATEWPQFHADPLHTGAVTSDFTAPRERWWSQNTGGPIEGSPVVSDGRVFVGSTDGKLYAFDAISGSRLWTFDAGGAISGTPALSGGILYLVTNDGKLFAIDAVTGKKRLSAGQGSPDPGATRTSPTIHEGRLYIGTEGGTVIAYNLFTLTKDWEFSIGEAELKTVIPSSKVLNNQTNTYTYSCTSDAPFAARPVRSSPAVYQDRVFFGSDVHALFAIDEFGFGGANAGKTQGVWRDTVKEECPPGGGAVATFSKAKLYPMMGDVIRASPVIDTRNGLVIVASYDNTVRAYNILDGTQRWNFSVDISGRDSRVISSPAVVDGKVYFGSFNGRFYALNASTTNPLGQELWNFTAGDAIWSSPAVSNGLLAFGADDETIYVLDANNGQERWRSRIGGDVRSSPALWTGGVVGTPITGGVVYVGGADGILYAFGGAKPPLPDLLIANISYPKDPLPLDGDVEVKVTVRNAGNSSAPATDLKLFIDGALASTQQVIALGPGENTTLTYVWHVPASNHTILATVDSAGLSREFDRGNNEMKVDTPVAETPPAPQPPQDEQQQQQQPPPVEPKKKKSPGFELLGLAAALGGVALLARRRR